MSILIPYANAWDHQENDQTIREYLNSSKSLG